MISLFARKATGAIFPVNKLGKGSKNTKKSK